jgi:hypothetical protein
MSTGRRVKSGGRPRRFPAMALLAWFTVVALGSGLVWTVISHAGASVVSNAAPLYADEATQNPVPQPSGSSTTHSSPTKSPEDKNTKKHDSSKPTTGPTTGPSQGEPSSNSSPSPSHNTTPKPDKSTPDTQRRTWSGKAGTVSVSCTGKRLRLIAAQPNVGYRVEVENEGSDELKVKFEPSGDGGETVVKAVCRGGTPRLTIESDDH